MWDDGQPPRFIERARRVNRNDSGWRVLAGHESDQHMEDPANFRVIQVRHLIDRCPMSKEIMDAPVGSPFHMQNDRSVSN